MDFDAEIKGLKARGTTLKGLSKTYERAHKELAFSQAGAQRVMDEINALGIAGCLDRLLEAIEPIAVENAMVATLEGTRRSPIWDERELLVCTDVEDADVVIMATIDAKGRVIVTDWEGEERVRPRTPAAATSMIAKFILRHRAQAEEAIAREQDAKAAEAKLEEREREKWRSKQLAAGPTAEQRAHAERLVQMARDGLLSADRITLVLDSPSLGLLAAEEGELRQLRTQALLQR